MTLFKMSIKAVMMSMVRVMISKKYHKERDEQLYYENDGEH